MPTTILPLDERCAISVNLLDGAVHLMSDRYVASVHVDCQGVNVAASVEEQIVGFRVALRPITAWVGVVVERNDRGEVTSCRVVDMNVWDKRDSVAAAVAAELLATVARKLRALET